ncbi:polysaccharide biosynthesis/export family protein [Oceanibaculum pacificum]|nr:polysaccharide biosynthesis/export family protein [Oceanibaculum pacificum]
MMRRWRAMAAIMTLLAGGMAGCAAPPAPELPTMTAAEALAAYTLAPGDAVRVTVWGQGDLTTQATIGTAGGIGMPLIGEVQAAGRTLPEVRQDITQRLAARYLVNPSVTVEVTAYRPFFVQGQVARPGSYDYRPAMDLRQAVAVAGGYTDRARAEALTITRDTGQGRVSLRAAPATPILPGDVIDVPRGGL